MKILNLLYLLMLLTAFVAPVFSARPAVLAVNCGTNSLGHEVVIEAHVMMMMEGRGLEERKKGGGGPRGIAGHPRGRPILPPQGLKALRRAFVNHGVKTPCKYSRSINMTWSSSAKCKEALPSGACFRETQMEVERVIKSSSSLSPSWVGFLLPVNHGT
ncbi:hypothetical protein CRENBAI_001885 [Crenichthys baileyi]|uniref:Uncharacterized protein n=1 Tax=Crenichthys baileyi TaxID=28760 RepID=A0AAV9QNP8_9TELE